MLCCARGSTAYNSYSGEYTYCGAAVCCCIRTARGCLCQSKKRWKMKTATENEVIINSRIKFPEDICTYMLAMANSVCLLALSSGIYERESTAKHGTAHHGTAWHSSAHHGTARHRTAQYGTARHHTHGTTPHGIARRCAAPLSYLS